MNHYFVVHVYGDGNQYYNSCQSSHVERLEGGRFESDGLNKALAWAHGASEAGVKPLTFCLFRSGDACVVAYYMRHEHAKNGDGRSIDFFHAIQFDDALQFPALTSAILMGFEANGLIRFVGGINDVAARKHSAGAIGQDVQTFLRETIESIEGRIEAAWPHWQKRKYGDPSSVQAVEHDFLGSPVFSWMTLAVQQASSPTDWVVRDSVLKGRSFTFVSADGGDKDIQGHDRRQASDLLRELLTSDLIGAAGQVFISGSLPTLSLPKLPAAPALEPRSKPPEHSIAVTDAIHMPSVPLGVNRWKSFATVIMAVIVLLAGGAALYSRVSEREGTALVPVVAPIPPFDVTPGSLPSPASNSSTNAPGVEARPVVTVDSPAGARQDVQPPAPMRAADVRPPPIPPRPHLPTPVTTALRPSRPRRPTRPANPAVSSNPTRPSTNVNVPAGTTSPSIAVPANAPAVLNAPAHPVTTPVTDQPRTPSTGTSAVPTTPSGVSTGAVDPSSSRVGESSPVRQALGGGPLPAPRVREAGATSPPWAAVPNAPTALPRAATPVVPRDVRR